MRVPPHPHIGLQTVTWLLDGEVLHRDSLGNQQLIRPGQLNLMTAGRGIAHAEESQADHPAVLHGVQLWVALPERWSGMEPSFMWWNFVAHRAEEIVQARSDWEAGSRFGEVTGFDGPALQAPPLPPGRLRPRA